MRFYDALLCSNSSTLVKVLAMSTIIKKCWSAEFLDAFHGLERSGDFQHRVRTFQTIPQLEFVVDVRKRSRSIWNQANQLGTEDLMDKAAKYHNWVALPLRSVTVDGLPFSVPVSASGFGQANTAQCGPFKVTFPCAACRDLKQGTS